MAKMKPGIDDDVEDVAPSVGTVPQALDDEPGRQPRGAGPMCPRCGAQGKQSLCKAASTVPQFTWFKCPECSFRVKWPRPLKRNQMGLGRRRPPMNVAARPHMKPIGE